jgi:hypothetical protein
MTRFVEKMETGNLYRITYLALGGNNRWTKKVMTAVYLDFNSLRRDIVLSLRPLAGTVTLSEQHNPIESIELVEEDVSSKYRDGARDKALPVKLPVSLGYVPRP